jgi:hypothetical protein
MTVALDKSELRTTLPYGLWKCADGREVLFNRNYRPLWERKNGVVAPADWNERVKFDGQGFFFDDWGSPWRRPENRPRIAGILADFLAGKPVRTTYGNRGTCMEEAAR